MELSRDGDSPVFYHLAVTYPWRGPDAAAGGIKRSYKRLAGEAPPEPHA